MSTAPVKSLIDELIAEVSEAQSLPDDRILMVFKGLTLEDAMNQARMAHIENPRAWSERVYLCGLCTITYEVRA